MFRGLTADLLGSCFSTVSLMVLQVEKGAKVILDTRDNKTEEIGSEKTILNIDQLRVAVPALYPGP